MPEYMTEIKKEFEDLLEKFDEYDRHILNCHSSPEEGFYEIRNTITNKITHCNGFLKGMAYQGASLNIDDDDLGF
ncbi:MAG: hypothetical protein GVY04_23745 [Cyanobacteria bacterium]|jgi:hypothetical protein|nr:hypothetical protein [Cyanobacteria bacterium GSL.Bin1]